MTLGDSSRSDRSTPAPVSGLTDVSAVATNGYTVWALRADGTVWVWGSNSGGEAGDGTTEHKDIPEPVPGLTGVTALTAANGCVFALRG